MAKAWEVKGLSPEKSLEECARRIITTRFREMMSYKEGAIDGSDIEAVHDMRVSSRRLRAAMQDFVDCFPKKKKFRKHLKKVKKLADAMGDVRDLDVLINCLEKDAQTLSDAEQIGVQNLIARLKQNREEGRKPMLEIFKKLDAGDFARKFLRFFEV
jgi:CHAD domain-containing protein